MKELQTNFMRRTLLTLTLLSVLLVFLSAPPAYAEPLEVTVTFDADGGSPVPEAQTIEYNTRATEPEDSPTKVGFYFDGWLLGEEVFDFDTLVTENIRLVASWKPPDGPTYVTVTFDTDGGTPVPDQQVVIVETKATKPEVDPKKPGYVFAGWYSEDNVEWDFDTEPVAGDIVLTAKYTPSSLDVTVGAWRQATDEYLKGAKIKLTRSDPPFEMTDTTPDSGKLVFTVTYGEEVKIEEVEAPEDYILGGPGPYLCRLNVNDTLEVKNLADGTADWVEYATPTLIFHHYKKWPMTVDKVSEENQDTTLAGAEIEIIGMDGSSRFHEISGQPDFLKNILLVEEYTYTLKEHVAPSGYDKLGDVTFHLDGRGKIVIDSGEATARNPVPPEVWPPKLILINKKTPTVPELYEINVLAKRRLTGELLVDAQIEYYEEDHHDDKMTLTSQTTPVPVQLKRGVIYHFEDKTPPSGYECWGYSSLECMMNDEGVFFIRKTRADSPWVETDPKDLTLYYHKLFDISLSKVAKGAPDKEQEGAHLQFGWPGQPDFFVGDSGAANFPKTFLIAEGIPYTFSELSAPSGYSQHGDIVFSLDKDGKIVVESGECEIKDDDPGNKPPVLVMVNEPVPDIYNIIKAAKATWYKDSINGLLIASDAPLDKFDHVKFDRIVLHPSNYEVNSGSTEVTLKKTFLDKQSPGTHEVMIVSTDGYAATTITIAKPDPKLPDTGDNSQWTMLWIGVLLVGGIALLVTHKKKKTASK